MIEHDPWIGSEYKRGIERQRLAVVGFSHYCEEDEEETRDFTVETVQGVIDGRWNISFFNQIKKLFLIREPQRILDTNNQLLARLCEVNG